VKKSISGDKNTEHGGSDHIPCLLTDPSHNAVQQNEALVLFALLYM